MSKAKSLIALASLLALPMIASVSVSAEESSCTISNTGPGSNNTCSTDTSYKCKVENDTVVIVDNNNQQVAQSGNATGGGNSSGGGATSGSATNSNGTTFDFTITNEGCTVAKVTQPTAPTPTPTANGMGAVTGGAGAVAAAPKPNMLARTSGENGLAVVASVVGVLTALVAGLRGYTLMQSRS